MSSYILKCERCQYQFELKRENASSTEPVGCPKCGCKMENKSFSVIAFCPECRRLLTFPLDAMTDNFMNCSSCGAKFSNPYQSLENDKTVPMENRQRLLRAGDFFDKYRIIRLLGAGGMAEVYLAEHLLLGRVCALKLMKKKNGDDIFLKRFLREAKITHDLVHPNIVRVYDIGCDVQTKYLYIAMEFIDGENLARQAASAMPECELLKIAESMGKVLSVLAKHGIVHRDIKPSNIMRNKNGSYILMDLGIAKIEFHGENGEYTLTMDNSIFGTPAFASPEQCRSPHSVDVRSDIYSLGATLYCLACGKPPYTGGSPIEIILNVLDGKPQPLTELRPELSERMVSLIECMMEKSPERRPQNADALQLMINAVFRGKPGAGYLRRRSIYWYAAGSLAVASLTGMLLMLPKNNAVPLHTGDLSSVPIRIPHQIPSREQSHVTIQVQSSPPPPSPQLLPSLPDVGMNEVKGTLEDRLTVCRKLIEELQKTDPEKNIWRNDCLRLFEKRLQTLTAQSGDKRKRMSDAKHIPPDSKMKTAIERKLKIQKIQSLKTIKSMRLWQPVIPELLKKKLDPDAAFAEPDGTVKPLIKLVMEGKITPALELLWTQCQGHF